MVRAAVRLGIRTVVKRVQTSHLPRLIVILVLLIKIRWRLREHPTYDCRYCESEFEYRNKLLHHVTTMHRDRQYACPQCKRSYIYVKNLTEDVNKMHKKLYRYRCETCNRGFMDRFIYYDHIGAHTGVKRHTCSICEIEFMNKSTLKTHVLHFNPTEASYIL